MAIRITKVYTRHGDAGETHLVGGGRVAKDDPRIESYGTIDELNAILGIVRAYNDEAPASACSRRLDRILRQVQNELFDLGSELATPPEAAWDGMITIDAAQVRTLERTIDECQRDLQPLRSFILPGGGLIAAFLHQARTVCRRAERDILRLMRHATVGPHVLGYVNRLSDLLFVLARWTSHHLGQPEYLWEKGLSLPPSRPRPRPLARTGRTPGRAAQSAPAPRPRGSRAAAARPRRGKR